jgi:hypothetical protein
MNVRQGCSLIALESVAFAMFFYCARIARELYVEIAAIEFNVSADLLARFDEWHTRAREAFWTLAVLWLVAITLAISQHAKAGKSSFDGLAYHRSGLLAVALVLPVAGLLVAWVFDLFLPRL